MPGEEVTSSRPISVADTRAISFGMFLAVISPLVLGTLAVIWHFVGVTGDLRNAMTEVKKDVGVLQTDVAALKIDSKKPIELSGMRDDVTSIRKMLTERRHPTPSSAFARPSP